MPPAASRRDNIEMLASRAAPASCTRNIGDPRCRYWPSERRRACCRSPSHIGWYFAVKKRQHACEPRGLSRNREIAASAIAPSEGRPWHNIVMKFADGGVALEFCPHRQGRRCHFQSTVAAKAAVVRSRYALLYMYCQINRAAAARMREHRCGGVAPHHRWLSLLSSLSAVLKTGGGSRPAC